MSSQASWAAPRDAATAGLGLHRPTAIVAAAGHLWIAERQSDTVTEVTTAGGLVRTIALRRKGVRDPIALAAAGGLLLVVDARGALAEVSAADGSVTRVVRGARYRLDRPDAVVTDGRRAWVLDRGANSITEIRLSDGALIRVIGARSHPAVTLHSPTAATLVAGRLWVVSHGGGAGSVTEIDASTARPVRVIRARHGSLDAPVGIAGADRRIWVTDSGDDSVTELSQAGHVVQVIANTSNNANYGFDAPTAVAASGDQVFVISPPGASPMITRIDGATADGLWFECNTNTPDPGFANPTGVTVADRHVWVVSPANDSLAELHMSDGSLIARFT